LVRTWKQELLPFSGSAGPLIEASNFLLFFAYMPLAAVRLRQEGIAARVTPLGAASRILRISD
jgi:hypothetical protein